MSESTTEQTPVIGIGPFQMNAGISSYSPGQLWSTQEYPQPKTSNFSNFYINNINGDPYESSSLEEFLCSGFFVRMPYRKKTTINAKINSITRGFPRFPDFED
jgi:hypothetical protein